LFFDKHFQLAVINKAHVDKDLSKLSCHRVIVFC
jgi:hypothetical protein